VFITRKSIEKPVLIVNIKNQSIFGRDIFLEVI